jgi:hypothetical protein
VAVRKGLSHGVGAVLLSLPALQHLVEKRPKVHLDCVEFTLKYRNGVRKVVDNLGTGLVNLARRSVALLCRMTAAMAIRDISDAYAMLGSLKLDLTGIAAAFAGRRDAPISLG